MRKRLLVAVIVALGGSALADPPPASPPGPPPAAPAKLPEKPPTPEQAADAVLAAVKAKDDRTLKALATYEQAWTYFESPGECGQRNVVCTGTLFRRLSCPSCHRSRS